MMQAMCQAAKQQTGKIIYNFISNWASMQIQIWSIYLCKKKKKKNNIIQWG